MTLVLERPAAAAKESVKRDGFIARRLTPTPLGVSHQSPLETAPADDMRRARAMFALWQLVRLAWRLLAVAKTATSQQKGRIVRESMETLGGAFIKVGQLLALRQDLFSSDFCLELGALHDRAMAFPGEESRRIIEEDYGQPLEQVFSEFDFQPIAAASIGQCHVARLRRTGALVAVKVQRPDAPAIFDRDLRLLVRLIAPFKRMKRIAYINWDDAHWELRDIVSEELDYRYEAAALREFRRTLRRHRKVYVPKVFRRHCTRRVLVLEFIQGVFMSEYLSAAAHEPEKLRQWEVANGIAAKAVGRRLLQSLYRQLFEDHVFHGDLHPGNIILLRNNWVCLIDFGTTGRLDIDFLNSFKDYMTAVSTQDFRTAVRKMLATIESIPHVDVDEMQADLLQAFRNWHSKTLIRELPHRQKSIQALGDELQPAMKKYRLSANWSFLRMNRAFGTLDVAIQQLLPQLDHPREMKRYLRASTRRAAARSRKPNWPEITKTTAGWTEYQNTAPATLEAAKADAAALSARSALNYQASASKMSFLISLLFLQLTRLVLVLIGIVFVANFMHQEWNAFPDPLSTGSHLDDLAADLPVLSWWEWILWTLVWIKVFRVTSSVGNRFADKDDNKPGGGARPGV
jgi:ubiquinone biosynthesis protein